MRLWQFVGLFLCCSVIALSGWLVDRGARAESVNTGSVTVVARFQIGPTTPGSIERQVTGGTAANVQIVGTALAATTDQGGRATVSNIPTGAYTSSPSAGVEVVVTAPGYGAFTYLDVPLDGSVILTPILAPEPRADDIGRLSAAPGGATTAGRRGCCYIRCT